MRRTLITSCAAVVLLAHLGGTASAETIVVKSGQTLWEISRRTGCTVAQLQAANDLRGSTIYAGQTLIVPACGKGAGAGTGRAKPAKPSAKPAAQARAKGGAKARGKKATAAAIDDGMPDPADYDLVPAGASAKVKVVKGQSIGAPWDGQLVGATRLAAGKGYHIRRPERAWGTAHAVAHVERAIKAVRKRFPRVHTLAVGDLSVKKGGSISLHRSHQSGRDVDLGFYFKKQPKGYPDAFVGYKAATLDLAATWALLYAFARTADEPGGVQAIFLDWEIQKLLYEWAIDRGVPEDYLGRLFQYPTRGGPGLVRHVDNHHDHFHIRFKCPDDDERCER